MFRGMDSRNKASVLNSRRKRNRRSIDTVVANRFEVLVGDMNNKTLNKLNSGDSFDNELVVFVPVVVKRNMGAGIRIDTRSGDDRSAEVTTDVFGDNRGITVIGLSINIEAIAMILVNSRLDFFERRTKPVMETIEKGGTKGAS